MFVVTGPDGAVYEVQAPPGASEAEVLQQVQAQAHPRMAGQDEAAYTRLAQDPKSTVADLQGFLRARGFDLDPATARAFVRARSRKGVQVADGVRYQLPAAPPKPLKDRTNTTLEGTSATAQEFLNGLLPGSGRFMAGVGGATGNTINALLGRDEWRPLDAFEAEQSGSDLDRGRLEQDHPNVANTAWAGGLATSFLLPEARILKGGSLRAGIVNGGLTNAGYGALSGVLNDTGDGHVTAPWGSDVNVGSPRIANAINGTVFGGVLGSAASPVARKVTGALSTARSNVPGVNATLNFLGNMPVIREVAHAAANGARLLSGEPAQAIGPRLSRADSLQQHASAAAERMLGQEMDRGTIATGMGTGDLPATPENVAAEVARRQALGVPAVPADVSDRLRPVLARAANSDGRTATKVRGVLSERQAQQGTRLRGHLAQELGPAADPIAEGEAIVQRAKDAAGPAYRQAYAQGSPMAITPELADVMRRPAFREALPQAYVNIRNRGGDPEALGFVVGHDGTVSLSRAPTFEAFDQVVRTLNGGVKRSELTGRPIHDNASASMATVAQDLDSILRQSNPAFAATKGNYADEMAVRDALERGQKVAGLSGPEIAAQLRTMPQHAQEAWTAGARTALADRATSTSLRPGTNGALSVRQALGLPGGGLTSAIGDAAKLNAIEAMSGRPGVIGRLDDRLEAEDQAYETFRDVASRGRRNGPSAAELLDHASTAFHAARKASHGNVLGALSSVVLRGNPAGTFGYREAVNDRLAGLLGAMEPQAVLDAMEAVTDRGTRDEANRAAINRTANRLANPIALQAAGQDTRAAPLDSDPEYDGAQLDVAPALPQAPPGTREPQHDLSGIPHVLSDGRVLQGFVQQPDGSFRATYGDPEDDQGGWQPM